MTITSTKKHIGFLGAILGILQGLAWTILSLFVILLYAEAWLPTLGTSFGARLELNLYTLYIAVAVKGLILKPVIVLAISCIYLILSLAWISASSVILQALTNENYGNIKVIYKSWSIICMITSALDFVVLILATIDYVYLLNNAGINGDLMVVSGGIIMTLAARGYVLWVVNVGLAILFMRFSAEVEDKILDHAPTHLPSQDMFVRPDTPQGNVNKAYNWESEKPRNPEKPKYPHSSAYGTPQNYNKPELLPKPSLKHNERVAKIGKPPSKLPPHNVSPPKVPGQQSSSIYPPRVPSPDYSPPASPYQPQLRSALKDRSQNAYRNY